MITGGRHDLPPEAINVVNQFKTLIVQYAQREHIDWFGKRIVKYIENECPDSVKYLDGVLVIDVKITSPVPGDWGDEMFNAMYRTEESLRLTAERQMKCIPEDYHLPENVRSKEHFVAIRWKLSKKMTEVR